MSVTPQRRRPLRATLLAVGVLVLIAGTLVFVMPTAAHHRLKALVTWTPSSLSETIEAGESQSIPLSLKTRRPLRNVVVSVPDELRPFVKVEPDQFKKIRRGDTVDIDLTISTPPFPLTKAGEGKIRLLREFRRRGRVFSLPVFFAGRLPVSVHVTGPIIDFDIPGGWETIRFDSSLLISRPGTIPERRDPEFGIDAPPADVIVSTLTNFERLPITRFAAQFDDGWFRTYADQEQLVVDGQNAIRFSQIDQDFSLAPALAMFVELSESDVLFVMAPGYDFELDVEGIDAFDQIVSSLIVDQ